MKRQSEIHGYRIFALVILVTVLFLLFLYLGLIQWFIHTMKPEKTASVTDGLQSVASVLSVLFGTAAAIGGALATLAVANLGLLLTRRQAELSAQQFLEQKVQIATDNYARLIFSLGAAFQAAALVNAHIPTKTIEEWRRDMGMSPNPSLKAAMDNLDKFVLMLLSDLHALGTDEFSAYCFHFAASSSKQTALGFIASGLKSMHRENPYTEMTVSNVSSIYGTLAVFRTVLADVTMETAFLARSFAGLIEVKCDVDRDKKPLINGLLVLGSLLYRQVAEDRSYIVSFGAAIVYDLVNSMPDGKVMKNALATRYPDFTRISGNFSPEFEPTTLMASPLKEAVKNADKLWQIFLTPI